jgi:hypothetical protein
MADDERPLLDAEHEADRSQQNDSERTPLISRSESTQRYGSSQTIQDEADDLGQPKHRPWPTLAALAGLSFLVLTVLVGGFIGPAIVESYARQATILKASHVSLDSYSSTGVTVRVQGSVTIDASRVKKSIVRNIGRAITSIARKAQSYPATAKILLPEYGNAVLGSVQIPGVVLDVRNGYINELDLYVEVMPDDPDGIRQVANDWIEGRLRQIRLRGDVNVGIRSGILNLGTQFISETVTIDGKQRCLSSYFAHD